MAETTTPAKLLTSDSVLSFSLASKNLSAKIDKTVPPLIAELGVSSTMAARDASPLALGAWFWTEASTATCWPSTIKV